MSEFSMQTMQAAVHQYFSGEKNEALVSMAAFFVMTIAATMLYLNSRSGFTKAFLITIVVCACLMFALGISLILRDGKTVMALASIGSIPEYVDALGKERDRLHVIIENYRYYKIGVFLIGIVALSCIVFSGRDWMHGVAVGLVVLVVSVILIDHFSEARARIYYKQIVDHHSHMIRSQEGHDRVPG